MPPKGKGKGGADSGKGSKGGKGGKASGGSGNRAPIILKISAIRLLS